MPNNIIASLLAIVLYCILSIFQLFPFAQDSSLNLVFTSFSEPVSLIILFSVCLMRSREHKGNLEPLFWLLLSGAFLSWLLFDLIQTVFFTDSSSPNYGFVSDISYFIFCALIVSAIEVKSYSEVSRTINKRNFITSISLFLFLIGAFSYFVLAPTESAKLQQANNNSFYFYALMDGYLAIRWWHIAYQAASNQRVSYLLFGLASAVWLSIDLVRLFYFPQVNANGLWLNLLPFLFLFLAIQSNKNMHEGLPSQNYFRRYHIFNSPIFFLGLVSIVLISQDEILSQQKTAAIENTEFIWVIGLLILSVVQVLELFETNKKRKLEIQTISKENQAFLKELDDRSQQLEQQMKTNQTILDSVNNPILTLTLSGEILTCNLATQNLLGYLEADLIGRSFSELVPESEEFSHFFDYQSYRQQLAKNTKGLELESKLISQSGMQVVVHISLSQGQGLTRDKIIVSIADIREQKKAEQQLHDLRDEFTANISHEFRTPLTIVNGIIDELMNSLDNSEQLYSLEVAKRNNLRLIHMVDQLLELSRLTSESIRISDLNASDWVEPLCLSYQTIAKDKNIDYQCSICQPVLIRGNQQAFEKILYNLISNAFKYTPEGGSINVVLEEQQDCYQLTVADTGIGISKKEQANIFDRFQRADVLSEQTIPGVGIGLALVKDLVNAMNWQLSVTSAVNKGSQFSVVIKKAEHPIAELQAPDSSQEPAVPMESNHQISLLAEEIKNHSASQSLKKSKFMILIIEDNFDMQRHLANIISPHHQCLVASNGAQGLSMADEFLPDLVLCDVMMPGIDGFEVLETLKKQPLTAHIPVIMLTAKTDRQSKLKGLRHEAEDYISKPFDAEELMLKLSNQIKLRKKLQQKYENQWQGFSQNSNDCSSEEPENEFLLVLNQQFEKFYKDASFTMSHLASELAMSDRQLQRKIKALVDVSPLELLKRFRLEKAKLQLKQNTQIGLVAQSCGFSSQTYFGRCFKEHFGVTPKLYQQS